MEKRSVLVKFLIYKRFKFFHTMANICPVIILDAVLIQIDAHPFIKFRQVCLLFFIIIGF